MSRRALLLAGTATLFAGTVAPLLAGCGSSDRTAPHGLLGSGTGSAATAGTSRQGSFTSRYRNGQQTGWAIGYPPGHGGKGLPVLVVLHGRGGDHTTAFAKLHLDEYLAAAVRAGTRPFAIASVDGGDHDYWHPRHSGDPAGMVVHEFLPLLAAQGLDTRRVGLLGWSMGGYGALYVASVLRARRCAVAVAESPAIWQHSWQSAAGAFDDAADFDEHAIWGRQQLLRGIALRIDCGASDGFAPITRILRASISPVPAGGIEPGAHDPDYWRTQAPAQLRFVGRHLP